VRRYGENWWTTILAEKSQLSTEADGDAWRSLSATFDNFRVESDEIHLAVDAADKLTTWADTKVQD